MGRNDIEPDELCEQEGFYEARRMPDGSIMAVGPKMYTTALYKDCDRFGHGVRYCYEFPVDALAALREWDGEGDPPGPWIKEKGHGVDRANPGRAGA